MKGKIENKFSLILASLLILSMILQIPTINIANASPPQPAVATPWTGTGAMAFWNIEGVTIQAVYEQYPQNGENEKIYIKVNHPTTGTSETTGYLRNMTGDPTWSMKSVSLNAVLAFPWTGGDMNHTISIDWKTSGTSTFNSITWPNSTTTLSIGEWRYGSGNTANATITIDGADHPGNYSSTWALVGQTRDPVDLSTWLGRGAMAHWDIIDGHSGNTITIDATYGQTNNESSKNNMLSVVANHGDGNSEAIGYDVTVTKWTMDEVIVNATLTFDWDGGDRAHDIRIVWKTSPPTAANSVILPDGTAKYWPGDYRSGSGDLANATITIDGSAGPHPGSFISNWALVGQTPQISMPEAWMGGGAMAHWNIIDRNGNPVSIDVVYGQQNIDRVADTLYIKVIHSQGVSEALAHAENMTSPTVWSMDEVTVNALMAFNWTSNSMRNHTIAIDWKANAPSTFNSITWQNGTTSVVEGEWRNGATATIIIDGSGPHPSNYTSSWALVGRTADPPVMGGWTGRGAMAHWNIIDGHSNNTISIDAAYEQKSTDGKNATDILDITVTHPQGVSHTIARDINVTRWSFDRVQINATMPFEWTDGDRNHTIVIEWNTSPPTTSNRLTYPNGTAVYRPGDWRSGSGNMANATIAIDSGKGPHPGNYTSDWAAVGQTPQFSIPKQWFGYAAMAHWDFVTEDGVPITIDAICTQYTADGKANLTYVKVIHPAGVSTAIGYAANVTYNSEFYDTYYSVNLAQLAFNWTSGGNQVFRNHNITLVWDSYTEAYSEGITWQNGTTSFLPGEWRSADKLTSATIIIDGTGLHPGTYKSDWAAIGHTEQFDREQAFSMTGNMAMAHWDVADNKGNTVGIDAIYGQRLNNGSTAANALYIRVFHPQGISESTGTFVNMTTIPVWGMNHVRVEATLSFNWTDGYRPHPIVIDWTTTGTPTQNKITWQDGEFSCLPGAWISGIGNTAKANMTIGGSGPHPSTYTSNWAAVGETLTFPAQTWLGQGAMAHWDINPIESDDVISIDAAYGQQPGGGKADMIWVRVVHPQGVSQVTGYAINYTSGPTWSANHVFLNTTLALNWTTKTGEKNMTHTIAIDWKSTGLTKADAITWQNGSITTVLGDWKSDVGTTATIVIDGMEDHNHQGNYTSKWAVIGIAETAPTPTPTPSPTTSPTNTPTQSPTTKPTPAPTETPSSNTITAATDSGSNITISIGGNITASQISNAAITTDSSTGTTTLSFNVTGTTGTVGFGNITVPKSSVPLGSTPSLLIDGVPAEEQGYTEDATNFYVWYIVHFSSHEVSVVFTAPQPSPTPAPPIGVETIVAAAAVIVIVAVLAVFVVLRNKKSAKKK